MKERSGGTEKGLTGEKRQKEKVEEVKDLVIGPENRGGNFFGREGEKNIKEDRVAGEERPAESIKNP